MDQVDTVQELPGYAEFMSRKNSLNVVLRDALPKSDLKTRIRSVGALTVGLEDPAVEVLNDPEATEREKTLAHTVLAAAQRVSDEVANLVVDISQSKEILTIVDGRHATV